MKLTKTALLVTFCMFVLIMLSSTVSSQEFEDVLEINRTYDYSFNWTVHVDEFDQLNETVIAKISQNNKTMDPLAFIHHENSSTYSIYGENTTTILRASIKNTNENNSYTLSVSIREIDGTETIITSSAISYPDVEPLFRRWELVDQGEVEINYSIYNQNSKPKNNYRITEKIDDVKSKHFRIDLPGELICGPYDTNFENLEGGTYSGYIQIGNDTVSNIARTNFQFTIPVQYCNKTSISCSGLPTKSNDDFTARLLITRPAYTLPLDGTVEMYVDENLYDTDTVSMGDLYLTATRSFQHPGLSPGEHDFLFKVKNGAGSLIGKYETSRYLESDHSEHSGYVSYEVSTLEKHSYGDELPVTLIIHNDADSSLDAKVKTEIDGETISEVYNYHVSAGNSLKTDFYLPAFYELGTHDIIIEIYDQDDFLLWDNNKEPIKVDVLYPDDLRLLEQFGDAVTSSTESEIDLMAQELAKEICLVDEEKPGIAISIVSGLFGQVTSEIATETADQAKIIMSLEVSEKILQTLNSDYNGAKREEKIDFAYDEINSEPSVSNAYLDISNRNDELKDVINETNSIPTVEKLQSLNEITNAKIIIIEDISGTANIYDHFNIDDSIFSPLYGQNLVSSSVLSRILSNSFDDCASQFNYVATHKGSLSIIYYAALLLCILLLTYLTIQSAGTVAAALYAAAISVMNYSITTLIGATITAGPALFMLISLLIAQQTFYFVAVPELVSHHDQALDLIEEQVTNDMINVASVDQVTLSSESNELIATATTSLSTSSSDPLVTFLYSPDGKLIDMIVEESETLRLSSTTKIPMVYGSGEYTVASGTLNDFESGNLETASIEYEAGNVLCSIDSTKNVYLQDENVVLNAIFVNELSTDLNDLNYIITLTENPMINKTGTIDIPANSNVSIPFEFSLNNDGNYHVYSMLFAGLGLACESETCFVIGNGSSISLNTAIPDTFEYGTIPYANVTLKCAGNENVDTLIIQTYSLDENKLIFENLTEYTVEANSTNNINVNLLNSSKPGEYRAIISYGNSSKSEDFIVSAENTIYINPLTNEMIYDTGDTIYINSTCKNRSFSLDNFEFTLEHVYPNGTTEVKQVSEVSTGNYLSVLNADTNGTHLLRTYGESDTMRVYGEDTFYIVNKRSNLLVSETYFSTETGTLALKITNEEDLPIEKAIVSFNDSQSFTDSKGYVSFYEKGTNNLTVKTEKSGYASYYGVYQALNPIEDSSAPSVEITSIQEGAVYDDSFIYLSGSLEDNVRVKSAYYVINNESMNTLDFDENGNFNVLIEDSRLKYGLNNVSVIAYDICGNAGEETVSFILKEPLRIVVNSPINGTTYNTFPDISVTTNENTTLVYSLNGNNETDVTQLVQHVVEGDNTLIIYAADLAGNTASREISFNYDPVPAAGFIANVTSGTVPLSVRFTDTSTNNPVNWSWDFGDNSTSAEQNPVHVYSDVGNFTVTLTAFNATGNASVTKSEYVRTVNESSGSGGPGDDMNATLAYWIEGVDSGDRTFVKIDELAPFETKVYAVQKVDGYVPNGSDVFLCFTDGTELSQFNTAAYSGTITYSNGYAQLYQNIDGQRLYSSNQFTCNGTVVVKMKTNANPSGKVGGVVGMGTPSSDRTHAYLRWNTYIHLCNYDPTNVDTSLIWSANTPYDFEFKQVGTLSEVFVNDVQRVNSIASDSPSELTPWRVMLGGHSNGYYQYVDYAYAKNLVSNEPTVTVEDMGTWYKVSIINNANETLTDYQVAVPSAYLNLSSIDESLRIVQQ
ncbi:MAG: PKD domain-containing protein [Methanolobus sp.]|nr:PKD domain-containing protein [Methanolobus sp.]